MSTDEDEREKKEGEKMEGRNERKWKRKREWKVERKESGERELSPIFHIKVQLKSLEHNGLTNPIQLRSESVIAIKTRHQSEFENRHTFSLPNESIFLPQKIFLEHFSCLERFLS